MTAVIIILALLLFITALLVLPFGVDITFKGDFSVKIKFLCIPVFRTSPPQKGKHAKQTEKKGKPKKEREENEALKETKEIFTFLRKKYGFLGAVRKIFAFLKEVLSEIKSLLGTVRVKKTVLNITAASPNAAQTAIEYGGVCSAVYPVLSCLNSCAKVGLKAINIKSDFEKKEPLFDFSLTVRLRFISLIISAFKIYKKYRQFILRENYNERK